MPRFSAPKSTGKKSAAKSRLKTPGSVPRTSKKNLTFGDDDEDMVNASETTFKPTATVMPGVFQTDKDSMATPFLSVQDPEDSPSRLFFQSSPRRNRGTEQQSHQIPKHPVSSGPSNKTLNVAQSIFGSGHNTANTGSPFNYGMRQGATKRQRQAPEKVVSNTASVFPGSTAGLQSTTGASRNLSPTPSESMALISVQDSTFNTSQKISNPVPLTVTPRDIPRCYLPDIPVPLRPSKRTLARSEQSKTSEILKQVLQEYDYESKYMASEEVGVHPRQDPADYMARSFGVSFGRGGLIVCPAQHFSEDTGRQHHTVHFRSAPSCKDVPYLSVLNEQFKASEDEKHAAEKQKDLHGILPGGDRRDAGGRGDGNG